MYRLILLFAVLSLAADSLDLTLRECTVTQAGGDPSGREGLNEFHRQGYQPAGHGSINAGVVRWGPGAERYTRFCRDNAGGGWLDICYKFLDLEFQHTNRSLGIRVVVRFITNILRIHTVVGSDG